MHRIQKVLQHISPSEPTKPTVRPARGDQAIYRKILTSSNVYVENWTMGPKDSGLEGLPKSWGITKKRLKGGLQDGVDTVEVSNGVLTALIVPTKGMNIQHLRMGNITINWNSPVKGIVHPFFNNLEDNNGLGWLYSFNGWMVRCGAEWSGHPGDDNGRLMSLHGKIAHIPASHVEVLVESDGTIRIKGIVREVWFKGANLELQTEISLAPGSRSISITDTLINKCPNKSQEFQMLYHANYGKPILQKGSRLKGTFQSVQAFNKEALSDIHNWDVYEKPGFVPPGGERLYCVTPFADNTGMAHVLLHDAKGRIGVSTKFRPSQLPCLSVWKNEDVEANGYVTGIEPGTTFPPNRTVERKAGRLGTLLPNQSRKFELEFTVHGNENHVKAATECIEEAKRTRSQYKPSIIANTLM
ncbi:hypothetical protein AAMO2058_000682800 [Amorphochlora amoebiformis]